MKASTFFKKKLSDSQPGHIIIAENLNSYKGFNLSSNVRIYIFQNQPAAFSINFISQNLSDNSIVLVPPGHVHFLSPLDSVDFSCIEIPKQTLSLTDKNFITRLVYQKQKHFQMNEYLDLEIQGFSRTHLNEFDKRNVLQKIKTHIELSLHEHFEDNNYDYELEELALNFETSIENNPRLSVEETKIKLYTDLFQCSDIMLQRACYQVFRESPQNILKHHLLVRTIPLLFNGKHSSIHIAQKLGYSSVNAFMKFIKTQTNTTPTKIKKQLCAISKI